MLLSWPVRLAPFLFAAVLLVVVLGACGGGANDSPDPILVATPAPAPASAATSQPSPTPTSSPPPSLPTPALDGVVRLPHDEGVHLSPLEWWYFNGHLTTESGQAFSYHFVTFQSVLPSGLTPRVAQLSWADHGKSLHLTGEQAALPFLEASSGRFDLSTNGWHMSGDGDTYQLSFRVGDYTVELEANSKNPAVLHHDTGLVDLDIAGKTYYYSRTGLETSGAVSISGVSNPVIGVSWMDHQWGDFTTAEIGWDWLSLSLDDGSDLMVSVVWEQAGSEHITTYGTYVPPDSPPMHLPGDDISLDPTGTWTSAVTGGVYPMGWNLRVDSLGLDLVLTPVIEEAEFVTSVFIPVIYWEGAVVATGSRDGAAVSGKGFVEMVGYVPSALVAPPAQP